MVAIVTGAGLGLSTSSREVLGASGQLGAGAHGQAAERVYVNGSNGNIIVQHQDEILAAQGLDLALTRTYNSQAVWDGDNEDQWRVSVYRKLQHLNGTINTILSSVQKVEADGGVTTFNYDVERGRYVSRAGGGALDTLYYDSGNAHLVFVDGTTQVQEIYGLDGRLISEVDLDGNTVRYEYTGSLVSRVISSSTKEGTNEAVDLVYEADRLMQLRQKTIDVQGNIISQTRVSYGYDNLNRLQMVNVDLSPEGSDTIGEHVYTTTYGYDGNSHRLASLEQTDGTSLAFHYDTQGRVELIIEALGDGANRTTTFDYSTAQELKVTDALNQISYLHYDSNSNLTQLRSAGGHIANYGYNANGDLISVDDGLTRLSYRYDTNGNLTQQWDAAGNTVSFSYDSSNRRLSETHYTGTDADGPENLYQASGGQTTRYVYNVQGHLRFEISPEGRVIEHRYSTETSSKGLRLSTRAYDIARYSTTDEASEQTLSNWVSALTKVQGELTEYEYDWRGQLQTTTRYARLNNNGSGSTTAIPPSITHYIYDARGQLRMHIDARELSTAYAYDGLGRLISSIDALQHTTFQNYDDAHHTSSVRYANGRMVISTYGPAGQLLSVRESDALGITDLGTTYYFYDNLGRQRLSVDPTGIKNYTLYDTAGHRVAEMDDAGSLTAYRYSISGQLLSTIHYAKPVNTSQLSNNNQPSALLLSNFTLENLSPIEDAADRRIWTLYNTAGLVGKTVNETGAVTEFTYDGTGQLIKTTRYSNLVDPSSIGSTSTAESVIPVPDATNDRFSRTFYDKDGLKRAELDGEGYITEYYYDDIGRQTMTTRYAQQTRATERATGALPALIIQADPVNDQYSYNYCDAQGRLIGTVDTQGYVSAMRYDLAGNLTQTQRYHTPVVASLNSEPATLLAAAGFATTTSRRTYDRLNRLETETTVDGTITEYIYDNAGLLASKTVALGAIEEDSKPRVTEYRYTLQGQLETITQPGKGVTRNYYDRANRLIKSEQQLTLTDSAVTLYFYETGFSTNTQGQPQRYTYIIDGAGYIDRRETDALGQVTEIRRSARAIPPASLAALQLASGGLIANDGRFNSLFNDVNDQHTRTSYTRNGLAAAVNDALNHSTRFNYNAFGEQTDIERELGDGSGTWVKTHVDYDHRGNRLQTITDSADGGLKLTTLEIHDAFGRLISTIDAAGNQRNNSYDRLGRVITLTDAMGNTRGMSYDAFNRVLTQTDAMNQITRTEYNDTLRKVTVTSPEGVVTESVSTRHGQILTVTVKDGNAGEQQTTHYSYDDNGNLLRTDNEDGSFSSNEYDLANRMITHYDSAGIATTYEYDAIGRVHKRIVDPSGLHLESTTSYSTTIAGQWVTQTDASGIETRTLYDAAGNCVLIKVASGTPDEHVTALNYDAAGHTVRIIDGADADGQASTGSRITETRFDTLGRRIEETIFNAVNESGNTVNLTTRYRFDSSGNMIASVDATGKSTYYVYDAENRLVDTIDPMGAVTENRYDRNGHVIEVTHYANAIDLARLHQRQDIFWRNDQSGSNDIWLMNGALTTSLPIGSNAAPLGWRLIGSGDFNGDRTDDLLWRNDQTGVSGLWLVHGAGYESIVLGTPITTTAWDIAGIGDFNGDGRDDIFWRNGASGANGIWAINEEGGVASLYLEAIPQGSGWELAAVADFNGDGKSDILWRNHESGFNGIWLMNGGSATLLNAGTMPLNWDVAATGDFNGDGKADIFWRNSQSGANGLWLSNSANFSIRQIDMVQTSNWQSVGAGDFNGDGKDDILWQDSQTSATLIWQMDGFSATRIEPVGPSRLLSEGWRIGAIGNLNGDTQVLEGHLTPSNISSLIARDEADQITRFAYDTDGRRVAELDSKGQLLRRQYDAFGNITRETRYAHPLVLKGPLNLDNAVVDSDLADQITHFVYDKLNRLAYSIDSEGGVSRRQYDAAGRLHAKWEYSSLLQITTAITNEPTLNDLDQWAETNNIRMSAHLTRYTYDHAGRLTFSLAAFNEDEGTLTQHIYNGELDIQETVFSHPVTLHSATFDFFSTSTISDFPLPSPAPNQDRFIRRLYDAAGRMIYSFTRLDSERYSITQYSYDKLGQRLTTRQFARSIHSIAAAETLPLATVRQLLDGLQNPEQDRFVRNVFDAAGRLIFVQTLIDYTDAGASIDPNDALRGENTRQAVTRNIYDDAGRLVRIIRYATPIAADIVLSADALPDTSPDDQIIDYLYNDKGQVRYTIDPDSYVTETCYDSFGRITEKAQWNARLGLDRSQPLPGTPATRLLIVADFLLNHDASKERFAYDTANNLVSHSQTISTDTDALEHYEYDAFGRKTHYWNAKGDLWRYVYNKNGHLLYEISPTVEMSTSTRYSSGNVTIGSTQSLSFITERHYNALGNVISQIEGSAIFDFEKNQLSSAGWVEKRLTEYEYDAAGHQIGITNPQFKAYIQEDAAQLTLGSSNPSQFETAFTPKTKVNYNALGQAVMNTTHATNTSKDESDQVNFKVYDASGLVRYEVDSDGYVTRYGYDVFGNQTELKRFAKAILNINQRREPFSLTELDSWVTQNTATDQDRNLTTAYTRAGQANDINEGMRFVVDTDSNLDSPDHYIAAKRTHSGYDAFGRIVRTETLAADSSQTTVADDKWNDTRTWYDHRGNKIAHFDAAGFYTRYDYDYQSNLIQETEYPNAVPVDAQQATVLFKPMPTLLGNIDVAIASISTTPGTLASDHKYTINLEISWDNSTYLLLAESAGILVSTNYGNAIARAQKGSNKALLSISTQTEGAAPLAENVQILGHTVVEGTDIRRTVHEYDGLRRETATVLKNIIYASSDTNNNAVIENLIGDARTEFTYDLVGNLLKKTEEGLDSGRRVMQDIHYDALGRSIEIIEPQHESTAALIEPADVVSMQPQAKFSWTGNEPQSLILSIKLSDLSAYGDGAIRIEADAIYLNKRVTKVKVFSKAPVDNVFSMPFEGYMPTFSNARIYKFIDGAFRLVYSESDRTGVRQLVIPRPTGGITAKLILPVGTALKNSPFTEISSLNGTVLGDRQQFDISALNIPSDTGQDFFSYEIRYEKDGEIVSRGTGVIPTDLAAGESYTAQTTPTPEFQGNRVLQATNIVKYNTFGFAVEQKRSGMSHTISGEAFGNPVAVMTEAHGGSITKSYSATGTVGWNNNGNTGQNKTVRIYYTATVSGSWSSSTTSYIEVAASASANTASYTIVLQSYDTPVITITKVEVLASDEQLTRTAYDSLGHKLQETDAAGKNIYYSYDALGRLGREWRTQTDADNHQQQSIIQYQYDERGNRLATIERVNARGLDRIANTPVMAVSSAPSLTPLSEEILGTSVALNMSMLQNFAKVRIEAEGVPTTTIARENISGSIMVYDWDGNGNYTVSVQLQTTSGEDNWIPIYQRINNADIYPQSMVWQAPGETDVEVQFRWKKEMDTNWNASRISPTGGVCAANLSTLGLIPSQNYQYEIVYSRWNGAYAHQSGSFTMTSSGAANLNVNTTSASPLRSAALLETIAGSMGRAESSEQAVQLVREQAHYNAFGEIDAKGITEEGHQVTWDRTLWAKATQLPPQRDNGWSEFYDYNQAGQLWRSQQQGGIVRIDLYDLQGNITQSLQAAAGTDLDLADSNAFATDQSVYTASTTLANAYQKTTTRYNAIGQMLAQKKPESVITTREAIAAPTIGLGFIKTEINYSAQFPYTSEATVTWDAMTGLPNDNYYVEIEYMPSDGDTTIRRVDFTNPTTTSAVIPNLFLSTSSSGGPIPIYVRRIGVYRSSDLKTLRLRTETINAYKEFGDWNSTGSGKLLSFARPVLRNNNVALFRYRAASSTGSWTVITMPLQESSDYYYFDLTQRTGLALGQYEYELYYYQTGQEDQITNLTAPSSDPGTPWAATYGTFNTTPGSENSVSSLGTNEQQTLRPSIRQQSDRWGNVLSVTDTTTGENSTTTYSYNRYNKRTRLNLPITINTTFDGNQTLIRTSAGSQASMVYYDVFGRQVGERDANGNLSTYQLDSAGSLRAESGEEGRRLSYRNDAFGRRIQKTLRLRAQQTTQIISYSYDAMDRLIISNEISGDTQTYTYDEFGRRIKVTNGENEESLTWYDSRGQVIRTVDAAGFENNTYYDHVGHKVRETNANFDSQTWRYNGMGQLLSRTTMEATTVHKMGTPENPGGTVHLSSGRQITYDYSISGQLLSEKYAANANDNLDIKTYSYYANGLINSISSFIRPHSSTTYTSIDTQSWQYDAQARQTREQYTHYNGSAVVNAFDTRYSYDVLGRLTQIADGYTHIHYEYDRVGNRTLIASSNWNSTTPAGSQWSRKEYYAYDKLNRVTWAQAALDSNNKLVINATQGEHYKYDDAGNRIEQIKQLMDGGTLKTRVTKYDYKTDNQLGANSIASISSGEAIGGDLNAIAQASASQTIQQQFIEYDQAGRLIKKIINNADVQNNDYEKGRLVYSDESNHWSMRMQYDAVGNTLQTVTTQASATDTVRTQYRRSDSYRESAKTSNRSIHNNPQSSGSTIISFDEHGQIQSVFDSDASTTRTFITDITGLIRAKTSQHGGETAKTQRYIYANNQLAGSHGEIDTTPRFDPGVSIDSNAVQTTPGQYLVNLGDTLQSIAQSVYGDSSRWYLLAEANNLGGNESVNPGQILTIPKISSVNYNDASSYKPYNPQIIIGDTTPTLPTPPVPKPMCSKAVATVIAVVIAVIVIVVFAIITQGSSLAYAPAMYGAIAGAIISAETQIVMIAAGYQDKFSWKQVAVSAAAGAISAGMAQGGPLAGNGWAMAASRAAVSSTISQGLSIALGLQKRFDWRAIAISAIAAGVGAKLGQNMELKNTDTSMTRLVNNVGKNLIQSTISQGLRLAVYGKGKMDWLSVATDTFQNTIADQQAYDAKQPKITDSMASEGQMGQTPQPMQAQQATNPGENFTNSLREDIPSYQASQTEIDDFLVESVRDRYGNDGSAGYLDVISNGGDYQAAERSAMNQIFETVSDNDYAGKIYKSTKNGVTQYSDQPELDDKSSQEKLDENANMRERLNNSKTKALPDDFGRQMLEDIYGRKPRLFFDIWYNKATQPSFKDAGATWERSIANSENYVENFDAIASYGVLGEKDFNAAWNDIYNTSNSSGYSVYSGAIFSHNSVPTGWSTVSSGTKNPGLDFAVLNDGFDGTINATDVRKLPVLNWDTNATFELHGCNTGISSINGGTAKSPPIAMTFSNAQGVTTFGNNGFSSFSTRENYFLPYVNNVIGQVSNVYLRSYGSNWAEGSNRWNSFVDAKPDALIPWVVFKNDK